MKKRSIISVFVLFLCATLLLAACNSGNGSGSKKDKESYPNTYEAPVQIMIDYKNSKEYQSTAEQLLVSLNGLFTDEIRGIADVLEGTERYKKQEDDFEDWLESFEDEYGSDWEYSFKIEDKDDVTEKKRVEVYQEFLIMANSIEDNLAEMEDFDQSDWEYYANIHYLTVQESKDLAAAISKLPSVLRDVNIDEGYYLQLDLILESGELDDPRQTNQTLYVFKVNGRWISSEAIRNLWSFSNILS